MSGESFGFEVKESDLMGRIGSLSVAGKRLETPYMFPVIHPVNQSVSTKELAEMGFGGLMTNSLILYSRRRAEVLEKGIHSLLGFEGVFMTDSGGYQVLEYGEVDVDYSQIADFQSKIGSNLAVTLDRPTGFSASKGYAEETVRYSLENSVKTMREFGGSKTVWVGPVQGGLFPRLVKRSAEGLTDAGYKFLALGSPVQVMQNYRFTDLVGMVVAAKGSIPYSTPLHLFGAGHPLTMALSVALGCDTFDSASYILFARQGRYMTERGVMRLEEMRYLPCSCHVCNSTSVSELSGMSRWEMSRRLALHNLHLLKMEMDSCKEAIWEGRLWDLVEEKAASHPRLLEALKELVREAPRLMAGTAQLKDKGLFVRGEVDLLRPEVTAARSRLKAASRRDSRKALLLISGESLPISRLHLEPPKNLVGLDIYRIHPTLGVYPAELDFVYPFTQTVHAKTRDSESAVPSAVLALRKRGYSQVKIALIDGKGGVRLLSPKSRLRPKGASPSPR